MIFKEDMYWEVVASEGFMMPRPPRRVGRVRSSLSTSLMALLPVSTGINLCRMTSSNGSNKSLVPETVWSISH